MARLILASASPRRRELLEGLGCSFEIDPADIDESLRATEQPGDYVRRMASEKAAVVLSRYRGQSCVILASDTSVVLGDRVLGKPVDRDDARQTLRQLSARQHLVLSAVCVATEGGERVELVETAVQFATLDAVAIEAYLATDEPWDKAGSYAIQGLAGAFVTRIDGSYSNVVGLPLAETRALLNQCGVSTLFDVPPT